MKTFIDCASARSKVERAKKHAAELEQIFGDFLKTDFCRVVIENDPATGKRVLMARSVNHMPVDAALALGDTIHNLSCALDYLIDQIVPGKTFPLHETRDELVRSFADAEPSGGKCGGGKKAGGNNTVKTAAPEIADLILDEIKPYKTGDGANDRGRAIWAIRKLDNIDKHRMVMPIVNIHTIHDFVALDSHDGSLMMGVTLSFRESVAMRFGLVSDCLQIADQGQPSADIMFPDGSLFENQPVIPTLAKLFEFASEVIDLFEAKLT